MNFLRLRYGIINYVNINIENIYEKDIWEWGLGYQLPPKGKLLKEYPSNYFHLEIIDMCSFTIRDAIYLLKLFENNKTQTVFHCACGFGRTATNILLLTFAKALCYFLKKCNKQEFNINKSKQNVIEFADYYLFQPDFTNLKELFSHQYNDIDGKIINEIFDLKLTPEHGEDSFSNTLLYHRMNTIKIAILFYITKSGLYIEELNKPITLHWYDNSKNKTETIQVNFKLEYLTKFMKDINARYPLILNKLFRCEYSATTVLKKMRILDGTNFPDTLNEIGPDHPAHLASVVPGGGRSKLLYKNLKRINKTK